MGWYIQKSQRVNGVPVGRHGQYLNYHEGWGRLPQPQLRRQAMAGRTSRRRSSPAPRCSAPSTAVASRSCRAAAGSGKSVRGTPGPRTLPPSTRANVRQTPQVGPARSNGQPASWNRRRIPPRAARSASGQGGSLNRRRPPGRAACPHLFAPLRFPGQSLADWRPRFPHVFG